MGEGGFSRHSDASICGLSLDDTTCEHMDHKPCSVCDHPYDDHYVTFGKTWQGCSECNDCEGYVYISEEWHATRMVPAADARVGIA